TLTNALAHPSPEVALYAARTLQSHHPKMLPDIVQQLLTHAVADVRQEALLQIEKQQLVDTIDAVKQCLVQDESSRVRASAMQTLISLDTTKALEYIFPFLDSPDSVLKETAMMCALKHGGPKITKVAEGYLLQNADSTDPHMRVKAAQMLGAQRGKNLVQPLRQLLEDKEVHVQKAALMAAGQAKYPQLWPTVVTAIPTNNTYKTAASALVKGGETSLSAIQKHFDQSDTTLQTRLRLVRVIKRIGGPQAIAFLVEHMNTPDEGLRTDVLSALEHLRYQAEEKDKTQFCEEINIEISHAAWLIATLQDLAQQTAKLEGHPALQFLLTTLHTQLNRTKNRILLYLAFSYGNYDLLTIRDALNADSDQQRAYALEILDTMLPSPAKQAILPLMEPLPYKQQLAQLDTISPQERLNWQDRLVKLLYQAPSGIDDHWLKICTVHTMGALSNSDLGLSLDTLETLVKNVSPTKNSDLMIETATWALNRLNRNDSLRSQYPELAKVFQSFQPKKSGGNSMFSTLENVIFLKSVDLFREAPDEALTQIAALLETVNVSPRDTIFQKGEASDSLYIIVSGQVRVYDNNIVLNTLKAGDVFGEMGLLDSRERLATVVAVTEAHLLRLDQEAFYELMENHTEVARKIIVVLSGYLRDLLYNISHLKSQPSSMVESVYLLRRNTLNKRRQEQAVTQQAWRTSK
ncbi:MAG: HEAT repeat domain-containing protein, partial [Chloroflexota bacterium]